MPSSAGPADLLADLAAALDAIGVRWYVFGAQAALVWGRPRLTTDVDVTVQSRVPTRDLVEALDARGFSMRVDGTDVFIEATRVVLHQLARDLFHRGADVQDQRAALRHRRRHRARNARLALGIQHLPLPVGDVLGGGALRPHPAMEARQHAVPGQQVDVSPHRLEGDAELARKFVDGGKALAADFFEQGGLAGIERHAGILVQTKTKTNDAAHTCFLFVLLLKRSEAKNCAPASREFK